MNFAEKLLKLREETGKTQAEVSEAFGVTKRTYQNYESGRMYPKNSQIYRRIAEFYGVPVNSLMSEEDMFFADAEEKYGLRGRFQAQKILEDAEALFAGGELIAEDREEFRRHMMRLFDEAKDQNKVRRKLGQ